MPRACLSLLIVSAIATITIPSIVAGSMMMSRSGVGRAVRSLPSGQARLAFSSAWVHPQKAVGPAGSFAAISRGVSLPPAVLLPSVFP